VISKYDKSLLLLSCLAGFYVNTNSSCHQQKHSARYQNNFSKCQIRISISLFTFNGLHNIPTLYNFALLICFVKTKIFILMKTQTLSANQSIEISTWKLVAKLGLLAIFCMGICYAFATGVSFLAAMF
jgi:hypothetical protein